MKRSTIAAVCVTAGTVPTLLATVFLFGCCVLPFHGVMHKLMPICDFAAKLTSGHTEHAEHEHQTTPARERNEPVKRIAAEAAATFVVVASVRTPEVDPPRPQTGYRSFITLGAVRCDQDVGLNILVRTFII